MARPSPREEPVTSAVRPVRSNRSVATSGGSSQRCRTANGEIGALEDGGQELDAEARAFHRIDVAVLDDRQAVTSSLYQPR